VSHRIIFAGGGTGGHLFSGIAVAEEMKRRDPNSEILFVGTPFGLEKEIVPKSGFRLELIRATPLKGAGTLARIKSLLRLPKAYAQSKKILKAFKPNLVIGIGGYASGPMTLAAHFSKIPTAIIEQNSIPGFTNRHLGRFADRIFISFRNAAKYFDPKKTVFSGNPTRRLEGLPAASQSSDRFCIFIMGGSQGAHALNAALEAALPLLLDAKTRLSFIHQTGPNDLEAVRLAYQKHGYQAEVFDFRQDLGPAYAQSRLMICRAGAGTITELQNKSKAGILVPYPFAADDHQFYNAKDMVDAGAAVLILNKDLNGEVVADRIRHFLDHPEEIQAMEAKARALSKPQAAAQVLDSCIALVKS